VRPAASGSALTQRWRPFSKQLDALGLMVADIPLDKLEEAAARNDIPGFQPTRSALAGYVDGQHKSY